MKVLRESDVVSLPMRSMSMVKLFHIPVKLSRCRVAFRDWKQKLPLHAAKARDMRSQVVPDRHRTEAFIRETIQLHDIPRKTDRIR